MGHITCGLVSDHCFLDLMEQFLSFRQHQLKILWPQRVTFQLGHFLHDFRFAESDSMMSCTFRFITAILLSSSSTAARLGHIAEADDLPPPVKAMQHEPLLPRLQLLEAVIESVSILSFDVFQ